MVAHWEGHISKEPAIGHSQPKGVGAQQRACPKFLDPTYAHNVWPNAARQPLWGRGIFIGIRESATFLNPRGGPRAITFGEPPTYTP